MCAEERSSCVLRTCCVFFFSSRRRHTRFDCDWSSDVCSSDLYFSVRDTGVGIAAEKQAAVFSPFRQVDASTTRHYGGTGLGLTISARLVEMMRGRIWLESTPGKGSTFHFTVRFGLAERAAEEPVHRGTPAVARRALPRPDAPKLAVLLVEDNSVNRRLAQMVLARHGHAITAVDSGAAALEALEHGRFDLILRSEEHTSELQSQSNIVCRLLLEKKKLVIIMVANKYAFLQITRRRFLNEWEAFKKVISRRNIRRRITIPLTLSNLKLLRRITRTENILHRNFTLFFFNIQNTPATNLFPPQSPFSV